MPVRVELVEPAFEDLERYAKSGSIKQFLAKLLFIEEHGQDAGRPLGRNLTGWRKTKLGDRDWRIVYRMNAPGTIAVVWVIGERTDSQCYGEAERRIRMLGDNPAAFSLAAALARLMERQRRR